MNWSRPGLAALVPITLSVAVPAVATAAGIVCELPGITWVGATACSATSNTRDAASIVVDPDDGTVTYGHTPLGGSYTTVVVTGTRPSDIELADNTDGHGTLSSATSESPTQGSGSMSASGAVTDIVSGTAQVIGHVAVGDPAVSTRLLAGNQVVPTLHASIAGELTSTPGGGVSGVSGAYIAFQDIISISSQQLAYVNGLVGRALESLTIQMHYLIHGNESASGTDNSTGSSGQASGSFSLQVIPLQGSSGAVSDGVHFDTSTATTIDTDDLLVRFEMFPGSRYLVQGILALDGAGTSLSGKTVDWKADYSNTAEYVGMTTYDPAGNLLAIPAVDLNSAYGFTYASIVPESGSPASVDEPGSGMLMMVGCLGVMSIGRRFLPRSRCRPDKGGR